MGENGGNLPHLLKAIQGKGLSALLQIKMGDKWGRLKAIQGKGLSAKMGEMGEIFRDLKGKTFISPCKSMSVKSKEEGN